MSYIIENIGTIITSLILIAIILSIIIRLKKSASEGSHSCGCGCESCALKNSCHSKKQ
ncbi:MAG: FeoB-associated Cys-rich membrane protein [Clostridia bacterium]|nr:FeoB-associated Cys-rich membrane protein [Clostridia bacterium]